MDTQEATSSGLLSSLRAELNGLLNGGSAHISFEHAVEDFPPDLRGTVPDGLPYSAWQIVEHIRIAQHDMLAFCKNTDGSYKEMKWPDDYWPDAPEPPSDAAWENALAAIQEDRIAFEQLLREGSAESLAKPFAWGGGQTLLKEILQVADHTAYHTGELIVLRRLLGAWGT